MSVSREVPEAVWRAREADDRERAQAEDDYDAHLASLPVRAPSRPRTSWLDAVTVLGATDLCPRCGFWIPVADMRDGHELRECDACWLVVETLP